MLERDNYVAEHILTKMSVTQYAEIVAGIQQIFAESVTSEYAQCILEHEILTENGETHTLMSEVIEDVIQTSAWDTEQIYSDSDVRLAIGRTLMQHMSIYA